MRIRNYELRITNFRILVVVLLLGGFGFAGISGAEGLDKRRAPKANIQLVIQQDLEKFRTKATVLEEKLDSEHERCARQYEMRLRAESERDQALAKVHMLEARLQAIRSWTEVDYDAKQPGVKRH